MNKLIIDLETTIDKYRNNDNINEKNIYLLFTNSAINMLEENIVHYILEYHTLYTNILDHYRSDLNTNMYKKYNDDNNLVYLMRFINTDSYKNKINTIQQIISDILLETKVNKYINLYTYSPFNEKDKTNEFIDFISNISQHINIFILKNEQF